MDALFESMSGITATGATVISDVDSIPKSFILWRGLMHWIGGMGIIVLILSFLRNLGADAAHFFNAEASVPKTRCSVTTDSIYSIEIMDIVRNIYNHLFYHALLRWY